jgi:hypothetical protein
LSFALVVGAIAVVAAVIFVVVRAGDAGREPAVPPGPPMANIDIVSDPVGASVFLADDGGLIGIAPLVLTRPQSDKDLTIIVRHEGYKDRRSTVPLLSPSGRIDVALTAIGEKDPVVPAPHDGIAP